MGKRGFTLVELLLVIVLLGIIAVIAIPTVGVITRALQNKMLEEKITFIEEAAELYGQDFKDSVINSTLNYNGYNCITINVIDLVPNYLDKDSDEDGCKDNKKCIVNPIDETKYLDSESVIIYYRNRRIKAKYVVDSSKDKCVK